MPGHHNALNATAAVVTAVVLGVDPAAAVAAAHGFLGTGRRFEARGEAGGVRVVDDYAHHPTEVAALLAAARPVAAGGRVLVLFQPHLFSRTATFAREFAQALAGADEVVVTGVYAAREEPDPAVSARTITDLVDAPGVVVAAVEDRVEAAHRVADAARPGDLVLTVGAGTSRSWAPSSSSASARVATAPRRPEGARPDASAAQASSRRAAAGPVGRGRAGRTARGPGPREAGPVRERAPRAGRGHADAAGAPRRGAGLRPRALVGRPPRRRASSCCAQRGRGAGTTTSVPRGASAAPTGVVSHGMAERLAERDAMRRHRVRTRILGWVAGLLVVAGLAWVAFLSPVLGLDLDRVTVSGEGTVIDPQQVRDVVAAADGVPLPRLDTVALREQVLDLNGVRDVEIRRAWPTGLAVLLESREPVVAVPVDDGFALLDADGVHVRTDPAVPRGCRRSTRRSTTRGARARRRARAAQRAPGRPPRAGRGGLGAHARRGQHDAAGRGRRRVGSSEEAALKVRVLQTLRAVPENAGVTVYDVSAPRLPVTR